MTGNSLTALFGATIGFVIGLETRPNRERLGPLFVVVLASGVAVGWWLAPNYVVPGWLAGLSWSAEGRWRERFAALALASMTYWRSRSG